MVCRWSGDHIKIIKSFNELKHRQEKYQAGHKCMAGISFASTRDGPQRLLIDGSSYDFLLVSLVFCIYRKPFVRCEQLERQHVCLCALSHGGGQGCECILAKPGSHQQWTTGAGESPKLPLTVSASTKKTKHVACDLFLIYLNEQ